MAQDTAAQDLFPVFSPLKRWAQLLLFTGSAILVGFGQPAWHVIPSLIAALAGYALFFRIILTQPRRRTRFWMGTLWFMVVQLIQLQWALSHPFIYIYALWFLSSLALGVQFGILCIFITPPQFRSLTRVAALAGFWALIEWSRIFILCGYTWNPIGLALSAHLWSLQTASIWGVFGLSFWVMLVNLLGVRAWMYRFAWSKALMYVVAAAIPFVFGFVHLGFHRQAMEEFEQKKNDPYNIVLVQPVFPVEEALNFDAQRNMVVFVTDEWKQILKIIAKHHGKDVDMIVLPEFVVPFGTWTPVYSYTIVKEAFIHEFGENVVNQLPPLVPPFAHWGKIGTGAPTWYVNNAYWLQAISNIYNSDVVAGLEDVDDVTGTDRILYSAAMHFKPHQATEEMLAQNYLEFKVSRYEKRVLVPMGEYIPFSFLTNMAREYGIFGSFTHGKEAKLFNHAKAPFGISICYEETFGDMMRESRLLGAELMINITSDAWYPDSLLPQQHFDHARLRSVESGIPLVRACNTGVTCGIDSLGQVVAVLGKTQRDREWTSDSLRFTVPTYTYHTPYSRVGDSLIVAVSLFFVLLGLRFRDGEY
jgi:apolipoprotein N-acyltransferase